MAGCRSLTDMEIASVLNALQHPRDKALFILGLRTGFRISELLSLTVGDVSHVGSVLDRIRILKGSLKGKAKSREVILHPQAREALALIVNRAPTDMLFASRNGGGAITRFTAHKILKQGFREAGVVGRVATHSMRKTFASKVYKALDKDLVATKEALGHTSILNTIKYLAPNQSAIDSAVLKD